MNYLLTDEYEHCSSCNARIEFFYYKFDDNPNLFCHSCAIQYYKEHFNEIEDLEQLKKDYPHYENDVDSLIEDTIYDNLNKYQYTI